MTEYFFPRVAKVSGELHLKGDKSISHRAVIFSALAHGESVINNLSGGEDVANTLACFRAMGVEAITEGGRLLVTGKGLHGLVPPRGSLWAGNSGTTTRLLAGVLAGQPFTSEITGDASLSSRPMQRVMLPLAAMGASVNASRGNYLPMAFQPVARLAGITYTLPVASAQVKSCVLLAALYAQGETMVIEPEPSRDHTERMLGLKTRRLQDGMHIWCSSGERPAPAEYHIPGDISSAAFYAVLASLLPGSRLVIRGASLNPTRTPYLSLLRNMGADITFEDIRTVVHEPMGDVVISGTGQLTNTQIPGGLVPLIIDEIPALSVAGVLAEGEFSVRGAAELRVKECDRIMALCHNFRLLGLDVEEYQDGFTVGGGIKKMPPVFASFNDHRIAMAFAILSSLFGKGGKIDNLECVNISNPAFLQNLKDLTGV